MRYQIRVFKLLPILNWTGYQFHARLQKIPSSGVLATFSFFYRGPSRPPSRINWTQFVQWLLQGILTRIPRKPIATCDFPWGGGGGSDPLPHYLCWIRTWVWLWRCEAVSGLIYNVQGLVLLVSAKIKWAVTCDFQQCGILTCVDSDEPLQPHFKLRHSKWCSVSSLTIIEYSSD